MRIRSMILTSGILLSLTACASSESARTATPDPLVINGVEVSPALGIDTSAELEEFVRSSEPKTLTLDVDTGEFTAVGPERPSSAGNSDNLTLPSTPTASSGETDEVLLKLAYTQTDAEIEAIISSGAPRAELFDPIANEVIAAVEVGAPWLVS